MDGDRNVIHSICMHSKSIQSCLTLCDLMDCSLPGSSVGFSSQEYWSELPCPPPGDLPDPGIEHISLMSPALAGRFFTTSATWKAHIVQCIIFFISLATHSNVLVWRIPGTEEPGGLPSVGSHRVGHDWSDLAAAAAKNNLLWEPGRFSSEILECLPVHKQIGTFYVCSLVLSSEGRDQVPHSAP